MALPTLQNFSLSNIQAILGGTPPISYSEYYKNSSSNYTSNISSLPNIGASLSISMFRGLSKDINVLYTTVGTFTYTVPSHINKICVLCVGGGGSGQYIQSGQPSGGGGGGLIWVNNIDVSVNKTFTVIVGAGGNGAGGPTINPSGQDGSASRFYSGTGTTFNIQANGGNGGATRTGGTYTLTNTAGFIIGTSGGGNGGNGGLGVTGWGGGGAGAAGYTGNGGNAASGSYSGAGVGLGGGGGGAAAGPSFGNGGGGVGILNGQGANGTAGGPSIPSGGW